MIQLLETINKEEYPEFSDSGYIYNGMIVPRVTNILSEMLHEDSLMQWSNYIGMYKRQKYKDVLEDAAMKGTLVHNGIENYISNGIDLVEPNNISYNYKREVMNAYDSFKLWWNTISKHKYKVLMQEEELICPWYGGTLDLLLEVDNKIYLFDFKTSNHLSYKYIIQLAAYRYILKSIYGIEVDYVGIIKLDKQSVNFEELIIDCNDDILNHAENCFHSLVYGYYQRKYIENDFKRRLNNGK